MDTRTGLIYEAESAAALAKKLDADETNCRVNTEYGPVYSTEITLRDLYKGFAVVGLFAQCANPNSQGIARRDYDALAGEAGALADAMLAERAKR